MKARQVLLFVFGVFAMLGLLWLVTPAEGVNLGPLNLRFASLERMAREAGEKKVDVDSVLNAVESRFRMEEDRKVLPYLPEAALQHHLRRCPGHDKVPVVDLKPKNSVPYSAANEVSFHDPSGCCPIRECRKRPASGTSMILS